MLVTTYYHTLRRPHPHATLPSVPDDVVPKRAMFLKCNIQNVMMMMQGQPFLQTPRVGNPEPSTIAGALASEYWDVTHL
jgi:hypothetical protein